MYACVLVIIYHHYNNSSCHHHNHYHHLLVFMTVICSVQYILHPDSLRYPMEVKINQPLVHYKRQQTSQQHRSGAFSPPGTIAIDEVKDEIRASGLGWKLESDAINKLVVKGLLDFERVARLVASAFYFSFSPFMFYKGYLKSVISPGTHIFSELCSFLF